MRSLYAFAALLLLPSLAAAQESAAVLAATDHVRALAASEFAPSADLDDLHPAHVSVDRRTGVTFVQVAQRHDGIEIFGATTPVSVGRTGRVVAAPSAMRIEANLAARANASTPALSAELAAERAIAHAPSLRTPEAPTRLADDPATDAPRTRVFTLVGTPRLVYQPTEAGALRLAWWLTVENEVGGHEMWAMRIDAATGAVLAVDDLVDRHTIAPRADAAPASLAPLAAPAPAPMEALAAGAYAYRVFPMPFESPNHGASALVTSPDDPQASQLGWHDTGSTLFAHTRGNNAWAYEDRANTTTGTGSGTNVALPTSGTVYDYAFNPTGTPDDNVNAAVVNLFYWGNVFHDALWHYGWDEAGGNMQTNNFGRGGNGSDPVRLEALDGSGTDNANFSTPPDGSSGRMQMYRWSAVPQFELLAPPEVAGQYPSRGGEFGGGLGTTTGTAVLALTLGGDQGRGCTAAEVGNAAEMVGNIALIQRGDCDFVQKARVAQQLGATGVAIYNCTPGSTGCSTSSPGEGLISMACPVGTTCTDIIIPALFVQESTGNLVAFSATPATARITIGQDRDSDFDAGIIAHEYGHGLSNRLVGGPNNTSCLGSTEQMGEGWSDYVGLMLTQQTGDTATQPRGVGTYVVFEPTDGIGIRNAPYSTDFALNDYTYQTLIEQGGTGLSIPHGVGFVWATMLWEMTWELIGAHGYDPDFYNADGTAGNQIAMNLVTTGLKLTPCSPGFVDGRDAILAADTQLYGGVHHQLIWRAFARRGLGQGASQGSPGSVNDGLASFVEPTVATETRPDGSAVSLLVTGANPFRAETRLALSLDRAQAVRVDVVDLLGRAVATLHDGPMTAETHVMTVAGASLAPGVYVVRATGEDFALTERITLAR